MYTVDFDKMTLKEKVLQTFVVSIREINKHGGPQEFFKKYKVGGMYYSKSQDPNIENRTETSLPTHPKRLAECKSCSTIPLLVCADGVWLNGQTIGAEARSLGGTQSEDDAYNYGKIIGMQMNENGIDWVLAPAIDMYYSRLMIMAATSDDPEITAKLYRNVIRGIQDQGICATAKHFPGIGTATNVNMHLAPSENTLEFDEWMKSYGYTYKEMFKENVCSVMTTHMTLASYDNEKHGGFYPIATYSEKLTKGLLKGEMGFNGAVVTDALIMGGMATGDLVAETVQAFKAGADLLLWPPIEAADAIVQAIENGQIPMSRLEDALERINKLRVFRDDALAKKTAQKPDAEFVNTTAENIIRRGVCLRRNDIGLIPINEKCKKFLILDATDDRTSAENLCKEFINRGYEADIDRVIYDTEFRVCWQDDFDKLQEKYDIVIFAINAEIRKWGEPMMLIWASHMFDKNKKIIVNFSSPFYADIIFPEDPTIIDANSSANKAAIEMIADGITGKANFEGKPAVKDIRTIK